MNSYIFIGRSGCGKGTQADLLKKFLELKGNHVLYIETGDEFRNFITGDKFANRRSKDAYEKDERQPDFLASLMWSNALINDFTGTEDIIFDGTPRSLPEAKTLETALVFFNFNRKFIIHIDVSKDWSQEKLLARGRSDDATIQKINKRLAWYDSDVMPAVEYFKNSPLYSFVSANGEQTVEKVHEDIASLVKEKL
jgi:adenylate kinase